MYLFRSNPVNRAVLYQFRFNSVNTAVLYLFRSNRAVLYLKIALLKFCLTSIGLFLHSMQTNSSISLKLRTSSLHLLHYILSKQCQPYLLRDSRKHKVNFDPSTESSSSSAKALVFLLDSDGTTEVKALLVFLWYCRFV